MPEPRVQVPTVAAPREPAAVCAGIDPGAHGRPPAFPPSGAAMPRPGRIDRVRDEATLLRFPVASP